MSWSGIELYETLRNEWSVRLVLTLMHSLWIGGVIGVLAVTGSWLLRRYSATVRYVVQVGLIFSLPISAVMTFFAVDLPAPEQTVVIPDQREESSVAPSLPASQPALVQSAMPVRSEASERITREETDAISGTTGVRSSGEATTRLPPDPVAVTSIPDAPFVIRAAPVVAWGYLMGVVACLLRLGVAVKAAQKLSRVSSPVTEPALLSMVAEQSRRVGLRLVPVIAYCERVAVPTVVGLIRPMILWPASLMTGLGPDHAAALLAHELAHIRRHDPLIYFAQRLVEALFFFHPVVWILSRSVNTQREACCDDRVVSLGHERMRYADALLRMAELCWAKRSEAAASLAACGTSQTQFEYRLQRLISLNRTPHPSLTGRVGLCLIAAAISAGTVAAMYHDLNGSHGPTFAAEESQGSQPVDTATATRSQPSPNTAFLLPDHRSVMAVGFDADGNQLVTASTQSFVSIRRWDLANRKLISEIKLASDKHGRRIYHNTLTLSKDCERVIAATDEYVGIWDTSTGELLQQLAIPKVGEQGWERDRAHFIACTPDLSHIAAALGTDYLRTTMVYDAYAVVWDTASGQVKRVIREKYANEFRDIALSADGRFVAATNGGTAFLWNASSGERLHQFSNRTPAWESSQPDLIKRHMLASLEFSPDTRLLAVGGTLGVRLVDTQTGQLVRQIEAPYRFSSGHPGLVFSSDGRQLVRTGTRTNRGNSVPIWSTQTGLKLRELSTEANVAAFSEDGRLLAVGFSDRHLGLGVWPLDENREASEPPVRPDPEPTLNRVAENTHYRGEKAEPFVARWNPVWSRTRGGLQYGFAITTDRREFPVGERVPMAAFVRNASGEPLQVDIRPDYFWNVPRVIQHNGEVVPLEKLALLGTVPRYRENLQPGETVGPFYFNIGLGANPRPGLQFWYPYLRSPEPGPHRLTHSVSLQTRPLGADGKPQDEQWSAHDLTSGTIQFEISEAPN